MRGLIDLVEVRPLFAIHLDVDERLVHDRRNLGVLERLVRHHVAPVARRIADRQQDRLVLRRAHARATPRPTDTSRPDCPRAAAGTGSSPRRDGCSLTYFRLAAPDRLPAMTSTPVWQSGRVRALLSCPRSGLRSACFVAVIPRNRRRAAPSRLRKMLPGPNRGPRVAGPHDLVTMILETPPARSHPRAERVLSAGICARVRIPSTGAFGRD